MFHSLKSKIVSVKMKIDAVKGFFKREPELSYHEFSDK